MKMKRALVKFNPIDSHMSGNLKSPDPDDKRMRSERRWRRREIMVDSLKHSLVASATKTGLKVCGSLASATKTDLKISGSTDVLIDKNDHMRDDEIDEDWKTFLATYTGDDDDEMDEDYISFLATYNSEIEMDCASNHSGGSNIGSDETDSDYRSFLVTYDPDVENDSAGNQSGGSNIGNDETDAEYISFLATYDPDVENDSAGNQSGGLNIGNDETDAEYISFLADPAVENDSVANQSGGSNVDVNFGNNNVKKEIEEGYNCFSNQFVPDYISNGVHVDEDDRLLRKSFSVGKNTLLSDQEFDTPKMQRVVDEDYKQILNSGRVVDGDFVYDSVMNVNDTSNVKDECNPSDSDLIVLESCPYCENTPFVSSKAYDSSCFGEEMHPKNNMQMTCIYHSQFRKRLVEYLDRPYDYEEYKSLLAKANERRQKERHLETRQGVIESYHCGGVTKSHLDSHPDVAKAIAMESKENRILFLLRGFFFWIQNTEGSFQPWLDKSCLEMMRRL